MIGGSTGRQYGPTEDSGQSKAKLRDAIEMIDFGAFTPPLLHIPPR